jgi:hypothetical protein
VLNRMSKGGLSRGIRKRESQEILVALRSQSNFRRCGFWPLFARERLSLKNIVEAFVAGSFFECGVETMGLDDPINHI